MIVKLMDKIVEMCYDELENGAETVCVDEYGKVIDMIKDLADARKNIRKAEYYEEIVESMRCDDDGMEGKSHIGRRKYMIDKTNADKQTVMNDLEMYLNELHGDIASMMSGSSAEEKSMVKVKLQSMIQML